LASITGTAAFTNVTSASSMFFSCTSLASIDTSAFTNVTNASQMFTGCRSLASITGTTAFTNVTNAYYMFWNCTSLASIDTATFTNVTNAGSMFSGCSKLASIDTATFTNVTNAGSMFSGCSKLAIIDKFGMPSSKCTSYSTMFSGCTSLSKITFTSASEYTAWYAKLITTNGASLTTSQISSMKQFSESPTLSTSKIYKYYLNTYKGSKVILYTLDKCCPYFIDKIEKVATDNGYKFVPYINGKEASSISSDIDISLKIDGTNVDFNKEITSATDSSIVSLVTGSRKLLSDKLINIDRFTFHVSKKTN
jgi:hypothetical protein